MLTDYYNYLLQNNYSKHTIRLYTRVAEEFKETDHIIPIKKRLHHLFVKWHNRNISNRSINAMKSALKRFIKYLALYHDRRLSDGLNYIHYNYGYHLPKKPDERHVKLLREIAQDIEDDQTSIIVYLISYHGLKGSTISSIKVSDFNKQESSLTIRYPYSKIKISFKGKLKKKMERLIKGKENTNPIFDKNGKALTNDQIWYLFKKLNTKYNIYITPRLARNQFVIDFLDRSKNILAVRDYIGIANIKRVAEFMPFTPDYVKSVKEKVNLMRFNSRLSTKIFKIKEKRENVKEKQPCQTKVRHRVTINRGKKRLNTFTPTRIHR
ncbi:hypothetical protein [Hutsoniella sourekii]|uniref:hypothetical protein n=1 Tax=Hutsoniella sourekii TaxID=87650 RepID=UPI000480D1BB|nr:hypothetical protein [Hutsoniella sourekii]